MSAFRFRFGKKKPADSPETGKDFTSSNSKDEKPKGPSGDL